MPAISLEHVSKSFDGLQVLTGIGLEVQRGEFVAIVGRSGCGKTTVLRLCAGLERPDSGRVLVDGAEVTAPGPRRLLVFQDHALYPWRTVLQNVALGLELASVPRHQRTEAARQAMARFGLTGFEGYYPQQLSGGMRQRASLARAFLMNPGLLLLDEPYGALDALTRLEMQNELRQHWQNSGMTVLLITHDVDEALYLADRVVVMSPRPGRILRSVTVDLEHPRDRTAPGFTSLRREIAGSLGLGA